MSDGRKNLIPISSRSTDEQRAIQSKGGKASGKSRRRRASMREALGAILSAPIKDKDTRRELKESGALELNANSLLALRLYQQAIEGDTRAARLVLQAIGEADAASLDVANARIDLSFIALESKFTESETEEPASNFEAALGRTAREVWPNAAPSPLASGGDATDGE